MRVSAAEMLQITALGRGIMQYCILKIEQVINFEVF